MYDMSIISRLCFSYKVHILWFFSIFGVEDWTILLYLFPWKSPGVKKKPFRQGKGIKMFPPTAGFKQTYLWITSCCSTNWNSGSGPMPHAKNRHYILWFAKDFHSSPTNRFRERLLIVPRTRTETIGPRGFFHASPAIWNSLPVDLRDPELSNGCFRNKLKTFLFSQIWCLLESIVLYSHFVFFLIMSIVCRACPRDILLAGAFEMSRLIDWLKTTWDSFSMRSNKSTLFNLKQYRSKY